MTFMSGWSPEGLICKDNRLSLIYRSIDRNSEYVIFFRSEIALQILDPNAFPRLLADRGDVQHALVEQYALESVPHTASAVAYRLSPVERTTSASAPLTRCR